MDYETVSGFSATWGIVYFFLVFLGVLIYALNPKSQKKFDHAANIPLKEEELDDKS